MSEFKRFDPMGWFLSACFSLLTGAVALVIAVHLIATVWVWLVLITSTVVVISLIATVLVAWHRRQPW